MAFLKFLTLAVSFPDAFLTLPYYSANLMKKPDSLAKACALGVVADLFEALGENNAETFVTQLFPTFKEYTKVTIRIRTTFNSFQCDEVSVRNQAIFGLGVLIGRGGATGASLIDNALEPLKVVESANPEVKDDVTGAIARMLLVARGEKQEVLAKDLIERLPLTDDHAGSGHQTCR